MGLTRISLAENMMCRHLSSDAISCLICLSVAPAFAICKWVVLDSSLVLPTTSGTYSSGKV